MAQQKNSNYEQYFLVEDPKIRESFRQTYDNTANLQAQVDKIVEIITSSSNADLAAIKTALTNEFS
jgi:hypothetical protein